MCVVACCGLDDNVKWGGVAEGMEWWYAGKQVWRNVQLSSVGSPVAVFGLVVLLRT
jgi:hypothetical protein